MKFGGREMPRFLVAFDYDQTIKEAAQSKFWMQSLFPDSTVPDRLRRMQKEKGWDTFYRECFKYLHKVRHSSSLGLNTHAL